MPDSNGTQSTTPTAAPLSSPPLSGTATSPPSEYRFGNDTSIPEYLRGKTATEVAQLTTKLVDAGFASLQAPRPPVQPQAATQTALDPNDFVTGAQFQAAQQQAFQQYVQPDLQAGIELAASSNLGFAKREYAKEFSRYGPEILTMLNGVPKKSWTIDNFAFIVDTVRGRHLADYQAEWQTEAGVRMEQTIRSGGAGGAAPVNQNKSNSLESEKIPDEWKARAQKAGLTESTIQEFCIKNDMTVADFYKQFETPRGQIVAEVQDGR